MDKPTSIKLPFLPSTKCSHKSIYFFQHSQTYRFFLPVKGKKERKHYLLIFFACYCLLLLIHTLTQRRWKFVRLRNGKIQANGSLFCMQYACLTSRDFSDVPKENFEGKKSKIQEIITCKWTVTESTQPHINFLR